MKVLLLLFVALSAVGASHHPMESKAILFFSMGNLLQLFVRFVLKNCKDLFYNAKILFFFTSIAYSISIEFTILKDFYIRKKNPFSAYGMVDGDIQVSPDEYEGLINGTFTFGSIRGGRWTNGDIAYEINSNIGTNCFYLLFLIRITLHLTPIVL